MYWYHAYICIAPVLNKLFNLVPNLLQGLKSLLHQLFTKQNRFLQEIIKAKAIYNLKKGNLALFLLRYELKHIFINFAWEQ